jgi:hypothetical protein
MTKTTWKALLKRLERVHESAQPLIDVDERPVRGDFAPSPKGDVKLFGRAAVRELIECLVLIDEKLDMDNWPGVRCRIDRQVEFFTRKPLIAVRELSLADFGSLSGDYFGNEEDLDGFDPVVARDGIGSLIRLLILEVKALANRKQVEPLSPEAAQETGNYWSREQFADFLEYEDPASVTKDIHEYRKKNDGQEPPWIVYLPPNKKKYKVRWKVYFQEMQAGRAKRPRSCRY